MSEVKKKNSATFYCHWILCDKNAFLILHILVKKDKIYIICAIYFFCTDLDQEVCIKQSQLWSGLNNLGQDRVSMGIWPLYYISLKSTNDYIDCVFTISIYSIRRGLRPLY